MQRFPARSVYGGEIRYWGRVGGKVRRNERPNLRRDGHLLLLVEIVVPARKGADRRATRAAQRGPERRHTERRPNESAAARADRTPAQRALLLRRHIGTGCHKEKHGDQNADTRNTRHGCLLSVVEPKKHQAVANMWTACADIYSAVSGRGKSRPNFVTAHRVGVPRPDERKFRKRKSRRAQAARRKSTVTLSPPEPRIDAVTVPPIASTLRRTIHRPMPK